MCPFFLLRLLLRRSVSFRFVSFPFVEIGFLRVVLIFSEDSTWVGRFCGGAELNRELKVRYLLWTRSSNIFPRDSGLEKSSAKIIDIKLKLVNAAPKTSSASSVFHLALPKLKSRHEPGLLQRS